MAVTKDKTWTCKALLLTQADEPQALRNFLYNLKRLLVEDFGWVVVGSSDSTAADSIVPGNYYTDRWLSGPSALVYVSTLPNAHSWIVLENANVATKLQLCIDCYRGGVGPALPGGGAARTVLSPTGVFSGGSTTARPTATDEFIGIDIGKPAPNVANNYVYAMSSTDGKCVRVFGTNNTPIEASFGWYLETPKNPPSWWTEKFITSGIDPATATMYRLWSTLNRAHLLGVIQGANPYRAVINGGAARSVYGAEEMYMTRVGGYDKTGVTYYMPYVDYNGDVTVAPIGVFLNNTSQRGWLGTLYDMYWTNPSMPCGVPLPGTGTPWNWVKMGDVLLPWNGSPPSWEIRAYY